MSITDILNELKINLKGTYSRDGSYVIDLEDSSDAFGKVYSILDKNPEVDYMESNSLLTVDNASMYSIPIYNFYVHNGNLMQVCIISTKGFR